MMKDFGATGTIKRRFQTDVIKREGDVIDHLQFLKSRYPDKSNRVLILVPTIKEIDGLIEQIKVIPGLSTLRVAELSSRNRRVDPSYDVMIATSIGRTGLDINPPADAVISSGRQRCFHRGQEIRDGRKAPYTNRNDMIQGIGRAGRLQDGIAIIDPNEGTGPMPIPYGAPMRFIFPVVAKYCETEILGSFPLPVGTPTPSTLDDDIRRDILGSAPDIPEAPYFVVRHPHAGREPLKGMQAIVLLHLAGVPTDQLMQMFRLLYAEQKSLPEEYKHVDRIIQNRLRFCSASFTECMGLINHGAVWWHLVKDSGRIEGARCFQDKLIRPVNGSWVAYNPADNIVYRDAETTTGILSPERELAKINQARLDGNWKLLKELYIAHTCPDCKSQKSPHFAKCSHCQQLQMPQTLPEQIKRKRELELARDIRNKRR